MVKRAKDEDEVEKDSAADAEASDDSAPNGDGKDIEKSAPPARGRSRDAGYLAGHAVIWLSILGAVAYLLVRGR